MSSTSCEPPPEMQATYDAIWAQGEAAFLAGKAEVDPHLADRAADRRRGVTLIVRPSAEVQARVAALLADLAGCEPEQHCYRPDELHVTVLSLFTASAHPEANLARLPEYRAAIAPVLAATAPFTIRFDGVTASPAAVLVQGYPAGEALLRLREGLRHALGAAGLGESLDRRYRITTAHLTAMRFAQPPRALPCLLERLRALRRCALGETVVEQIDLVENDWYMAHDRVRMVEWFTLRCG